MKIAIISDIHSNVFALRAVIKDAQDQLIENYIVLGDVFGYYPWANETFKELLNLSILKIIKGNHDIIVEKEVTFDQSSPIHIELAQHNRNMLLDENPQAITWLINLNTTEVFSLNNKKIIMHHGTPTDPIAGRYYPDDNQRYPWFPNKEEILLLGQTHYPLYKKELPGVIINPGSVGQPRDGNINASYGILNTLNFHYTQKRVIYDLEKTVKKLKEINWNASAIKALTRNNTNKL